MKQLNLTSTDGHGNRPSGHLQQTPAVMSLRNAVSAFDIKTDDYRLIVEAINEGIIITQDNAICYANPRVCEFSGYSPEEITGQSLLNFIHPQDRQMVETHHLNRTAGIEQPEVYLMRIVDKQGNVRWIKNSGVTIEWKGRPATLNLLSDVTRQKEIEDALKANENRFQVIAEQTGQLIYEYHHASGRIAWSGAIEKITGYTEAEFKAIDYQRWQQMIHPDDRERVKTMLSEACQQRHPFRMEYRFERRDRTFTLVENSGVFLDGGNGTIDRVLGVMKDITDRRQTEKELRQYREHLETLVNVRTLQLKTVNRHLQTELKERRDVEDALRRSEERYRFLIENTAEGYYLVDHDTGRFIYTNSKACDLLGHTLDEMAELTIWDVLAEDAHGEFKVQLNDRKTENTRIESTSIYTCIRRDGSCFRGEISSSVDFFQGRPVVQGIIRDVTENERFLNRLQEIQKLETIATLAGGIAHDFNNILMAMQGNVSLLLVKLNATHPLYGKVENIQQQIRNGANLIRQLLGFARGGKYEAKVIDLNRLVDDTTRIFNPVKKRIQLELALQDGIWMVQADRGQIEQALLNLFVNAWQAMPDGGQLQITTRNRDVQADEAGAHQVNAGRYVNISVRDTGIGMDPDTMKRIFDPFFTTKESSRGTGLGLSSAYGIVNNHGGFIEVDSRLGEGTAFDVYLPATESTLQKESDLTDTILVGDETVLFVDDEEMILEAGVEMLEDFGYTVHPATSGEQALALYDTHAQAIDMVVLDLNMPGMSGQDVFYRMREQNPSMKILVTSGQQNVGEIQQFLDANRIDFLAKPFTAIDLSQKIRRLLGS